MRAFRLRETAVVISGRQDFESRRGLLHVGVEIVKNRVRRFLRCAQMGAVPGGLELRRLSHELLCSHFP